MASARKRGQRWTGLFRGASGAQRSAATFDTEKEALKVAQGEQSLHGRGLDRARAGAPSDLRAERRALLPVQLHEREPDELADAHDLLERRVDEHAGDFGAPSAVGLDHVWPNCFRV